MSEKTHPIIQTMLDYFATTDWTLEQLPGKNIWRSQVRGNHDVMTRYIQIDIDDNQLMFYSVYPENIEEAIRERMAVVLTHFNYNMAIGNFELDLSDGEIRYKTSMDVTNTALNRDLLRNLVIHNVRNIDYYYLQIGQAIEDARIYGVGNES